MWQFKDNKTQNIWLVLCMINTLGALGGRELLDMIYARMKDIHDQCKMNFQSGPLDAEATLPQAYSSKTKISESCFYVIHPGQGQKWSVSTDAGDVKAWN